MRQYVLMSFILIHVLTLQGCSIRQTVSSASIQEEVTPSGDEYTNTIGMCLKWIPAGTYLMGSPAEEVAPPAYKRIEPLHNVRIPVGFYLGVREVTNAQFWLFVSEAKYVPEDPAGFLQHIGGGSLDPP